MVGNIGLERAVSAGILASLSYNRKKKRLLGIHEVLLDKKKAAVANIDPTLLQKYAHT